MNEDFKGTIIAAKTDGTPSPVKRDREEYKGANGLPYDANEEFVPYAMTIEHLKLLQWEQSPIAKIDLIY